MFKLGYILVDKSECEKCALENIEPNMPIAWRNT